MTETTKYLLMLAIVVLMLPVASAEQTRLFNGSSLEGWTFHKRSTDEQEVDQPWVVQRGMLIDRGVASGYLIHKKAFENYALSLEVRTMSTAEGNGFAAGSLGSVFVNAVPEQAQYARVPKSIEISMRMQGDVFFRDIDRETFFGPREKWVFEAPDLPNSVEKEMGEWNELTVISNGSKLTVSINGQVVNQVEPMNRTKGAVAIKCDRGVIAAPTFYRNIVVRDLTDADLAMERRATTAFAAASTAAAQRQAAEETQRAKEEQMRAESERQEERRQQQFAKQWTEVPVANNPNFVADVRRLPFPSNARKIEFSRSFQTVELESQLSLAVLSQFYRVEMAARGWKVVETDIEEDELTVTYKQGESAVEINLHANSDGVDVELACDKLSFDGTNDPASMVKLGVPQPPAYLVLQSEFALPENCKSEEYESGNRRLFKSTMKMPELYEFLTRQLRQKGYREIRRPIITANRHYSVFAKGSVQLGVNSFDHKIGSRVVLTCESAPR